MYSKERFSCRPSHDLHPPRTHQDGQAKEYLPLKRADEGHAIFPRFGFGSVCKGERFSPPRLDSATTGWFSPREARLCSMPSEHLTRADHGKFCCLALFLYPAPSRIRRKGYGIPGHALMHKMLHRFSRTGPTPHTRPAPAPSHCDGARENSERWVLRMKWRGFIKTIALHYPIRT